MAVYPTKTRKQNSIYSRRKSGITLICVFSVLFVLLCTNIIKPLNTLVLGTIGLLIFPLCVFLITVGVFKIIGKNVKVSKYLVILLCLWLFVFVMILQMATSTGLDNGFGQYLLTTFKNSDTAGGVIFGLLLYPLYYFTYSVATYIILSIALVVITAFIIDRLYVEKKSSNSNFASTTSDTYVNDVDIEKDDEVEEAPYYSTNIPRETDEDSIFIADDEEDKKSALKTLGLDSKESSEDSISKNISEKPSYIELLEEGMNKKTEEVSEDRREKPSIYVHDDTEFDNKNISTNSIKSIKETENIDQTAKENERRKQDALNYLNITKGKFSSSKDNAKPIISSEEKSQPKVTLENNTSKNTLSKTNETFAYNPFKEMQNNNTTPNLDNPSRVTTDSQSNTQMELTPLFESNLKNITKTVETGRTTVNSTNATKLANEYYNLDTKDNIVDPVRIPSAPVSILHEPTTKAKAHTYRTPPKAYNRPPLDLLKKYPSTIEADDAYITEKGNLIVDTLRAFKIETKIINATKGPTFTRFELQMAPGISVNTINNKINDLSMALESKCRVQVPIPGKNAFGIEVPNKKRMIVGLRDILESSNFKDSRSPLTFALGKDISAECKVACVDKLVHTLVAGATGTGKSVCLNALLVSLFYKTSPEDLKILLIDPKTVEFTPFNGLPHMLIPNTITECEKAVMALDWLVSEMDNRYNRLAQLGVRKISEYNETAEVKTGAVPKMFYIVVIFDEVGDFMTHAKKEIEEKIRLLAAKSRACGIHLVLATQRPTVDVITGTIKANLPSRIALTTSSQTDSKTILDASGAETLLGMGDMLFLPQGSSDPQRIQGCYVDDGELKAVLKYIRENNECYFDDTIEDQMFNKNDEFEFESGANAEVFDPMLKDALKFFIRTKNASTSSLQGYFGMGYPRANKIILQMERAGFVSPKDTNNNRRQLFITPQEFAEKFGEEVDE